MIRIFAAVLLACFAAYAGAEPVDLSCYWEKPRAKIVGAAEPASRLFASAEEPLYLRLDVAANTVANNDPNYSQAVILPSLRLSSSGTTATISAATPNITGLQSASSLLEITIDRYSLRSEMILLMAPDATSRNLSTQWTRAGQCGARKF